MKKTLIIACDGEAASGKSTGAKLISKKYKLKLLNSGLLYRYASKKILDKKPNNIIPFLKKIFKNVSYKTISKQKLHSQSISTHVGILAKRKKVRGEGASLADACLLWKEVRRGEAFYAEHTKLCTEGREDRGKELSPDPKGAEGIFQRISVYFIKRLIPVT